MRTENGGSSGDLVLGVRSTTVFGPVFVIQENIIYIKYMGGSVVEEKIIMETDSVLDKASYRWIMTSFNKKNMILGRVLLALLPLYGLGMLLVCGQDTKWIAILLIAVSVMLGIKLYVIMPKKYDAVVEAYEKSHENENHYKFYETYVERTNVTGNLVMQYESFRVLRETESLFMFWTETNKLILLQKKNVPEEQYEFLRGLVSPEKAAAYEKKVAKKRAVQLILLAVICLGFVGMLILALR